jgi:Fur family ferric uptake transcriptional regulator
MAGAHLRCTGPDAAPQVIPIKMSRSPSSPQARRAAPSTPALAERLRGKARKLTDQRKAILGVLQHHPHPLTIKEVRERIGRKECDLATVYRSMHLLEEMGVVQRFDFGQGGARFELIREGEDGHHHHLVCIDCAAVVELEECFPAELEERIARDHRFQRVTHRLEFFGVCPRCQ